MLLIEYITHFVGSNVELRTEPWKFDIIFIASDSDLSTNIAI